MSSGRLAVMVSAALLTGCGGAAQPEARQVAAAGDCLAAWNASGNEANRRRVADEGFEEARVDEFVQIGYFAEGASEQQRGEARREGCSYLFHDDRRYLSVSGTWQGDGLRWGVLPELSGPWSAEQEASADDGVRVLPDGRLKELRAAS
jgi:hypothetical protein